MEDNESMPIYVYHITVLILLVLNPALDPLTTKLLKNSKNPYRRIYSYVWGMALSMACAIVGIVYSPGVWYVSPLGKPSLIWSVIGTVVFGYFLYVLAKTGWKVIRKPEIRAKTHAKFADFDFFLPQTHAERWVFVAVSLVAGFAEEVIFRGFLIRYLNDTLGWMTVIAIPVSIIAFGLNHGYQGWQRIISTGAIGALFLVMAVGFESLIPGMVLHAIVDLRVLLLTLPVGHALLQSDLQETAAVPSPS